AAKGGLDSRGTLDLSRGTGLPRSPGVTSFVRLEEVASYLLPKPQVWSNLDVFARLHPPDDHRHAEFLIIIFEMSDARPPRVFNFDADNLKKEWEDWHQNFEIYLTASKKHAESNPVKIAMLLNQLGSKGVELYNALKADAEITSTVETKEAALSKYTDVVSAFATHFAPRKNVLHERCKFNKLNLNSGQSLIEYVTALKNAAASCEFLERNNMIRDRLISQVPDEALLNRLLDEGDTLTLERTIDLCKLHDARKMEIQDFTNGENKIDAVRNFNRGSNRFRKPNKNLKVESKNVGNAEKCTGRRSEAYQCKKCGYTHTAGKCPAYGKTCSFCRKLHHFEIGCKIKKSAIQPRRTHAITEPSEESDDSLYLDSINAAVNKVEATKEWSVIGRIFGQKIKFKLDCGSQVNLLPLRCFKDGKPLAFASRSLNKSEKRYAMIEKELLGICYALEHFHYYVYGRDVLIQTDHKPLINISLRNIDKVPNRLQRMLLKIMKNYVDGSTKIVHSSRNKGAHRSYVGEFESDPDAEVMLEILAKLGQTIMRANDLEKYSLTFVPITVIYSVD
ncbi:unnamed protein product, partial [Nesidiocoris tenuis]